MMNGISALKVDASPEDKIEVTVDEPIQVNKQSNINVDNQVSDDFIKIKNVALTDNETSLREEDKENEKNLLLESLKAIAEVEDNELVIRNRNLAFSIDDDSGNFVIKVTDTKTDEVIRQIPSEEFIRVAKRIANLSEELNSAQGLLFESQV
ncbi:flagellar protein FlaG [Colwelliaceae bacterium 6441]